MLGITPLVSMSDRRLGLITNSSIPRVSAKVMLATSTSRNVSPICSRNSRSFLPADNTQPSLDLKLLVPQGTKNQNLLKIVTGVFNILQRFSQNNPRVRLIIRHI